MSQSTTIPNPDLAAYSDFSGLLSIAKAAEARLQAFFDTDAAALKYLETFDHAIQSLARLTAVRKTLLHLSQPSEQSSEKRSEKSRAGFQPAIPSTLQNEISLSPERGRPTPSGDSPLPSPLFSAPSAPPAVESEISSPSLRVPTPCLPNSVVQDKISSSLRRLPSSSRSGRISFPLTIPQLSLPTRLPNLTVPFIRSVPASPKRFRSLLKTVQQNLLDLTNATHESLKAKFNGHRQPRPTWYERMRHLLNLPPLTDRAAVLYGLEPPRNRKTKSSTSISSAPSPFDKPMSTAKYDKLADEAFYNGKGKLYTHWNQAEQCFFQSRYPPQPPPTPWMEQDPKTKKWKKATRAA